MRGQKWCKDNFVVPFLANICFILYLRVFGKNYSFVSKKTIFPLYNMHIIMFIATEIHINSKLLANSGA